MARGPHSTDHRKKIKESLLRYHAANGPTDPEAQRIRENRREARKLGKMRRAILREKGLAK